MTRDLVETINRMLDAIPASETEFITDLRTEKQSALHSTTEQLPLRWIQTGKTVVDNLPADETKWTPWQSKLMNVWKEE